MPTFGGRKFAPMDTADGNVYIYTDASAPRRTGKWGIGVYCGVNPSLADLTQHRQLDGRKKSGEVEVFAATEALKILWESEKYSHESGSLVVLRTDCQLMVLKIKRIITGGTVRQPSEGKSFDNAVRALVQLAEKFPQGVRFEHVYAGSTDEGIQAADRLATRASYGLTAERRGHDHSRSRCVAARPSRNFFHPASFRANEKCHVEFNPYSRHDELSALLESFRVSEPAQKTQPNATDDPERSSSELAMIFLLFSALIAIIVGLLAKVLYAWWNDDGVGVGPANVVGIDEETEAIKDAEFLLRLREAHEKAARKYDDTPVDLP